MNALQKLNSANVSGKFICVGLDTDPKKIPSLLSTHPNPTVEFNKKIIEATKEFAAAYKLNLAFYESEGITGIKNLEETLSFIPKNILSIADGKRGDIGNTSEMYAKSVFDYFKFDSATLNPFMGKDSLAPFLSRTDKLNFILALTSNPGSADFQKLHLKSGEYLFQYLIKKVNSWNENQNCGIVFGATNISELKDNIEIINNLPLLIPGVGAQDGNPEELSKLLFSNGIKTFLINVSRAILYKSSAENFAEEAKNEIVRLTKIISQNLH
ncbi:MAG: orotidine-5'-phosphate decarboxylase [Ignavibacteriales bacterium]